MHPILLRIPLPGWDLPLLGRLDAIPIYSYGVMLGLSLVVGWYLTLSLAERDGLPREQMANCYVITALVAVAGSRVAYVVTNPGEFHGIRDALSFQGGGLVAYGGFLGGFLGSYLYLKRKRLRLVPWADVAVPSLASGLAITRIGCYLYGCDYGRPLSDGAPHWLRLLGTFPRWPEGTLVKGGGSPAFAEHVARKLIEPAASHSLPVHPTQLYESLTGVALLALLLWVRRRQRFRGQVFFVATFAYGVARFLLEILRDDPERGGVPVTMPPHVLVPLCLLLFAVGYALAIARIVDHPAIRRLSQVVAFVPALVALLWLWPQAYAKVEPAMLSTSQLIGLASALAVAAMYQVYDRAALAHPEAAMSLGLGERPTTERADDDGPALEDAEQAERVAKGRERTAAGKKRGVPAKKRKKKSRPLDQEGDPSTSAAADEGAENGSGGDTSAAQPDESPEEPET